MEEIFLEIEVLASFSSYSFVTYNLAWIYSTSFNSETPSMSKKTKIALYLSRTPELYDSNNSFLIVRIP